MTVLNMAGIVPKLYIMYRYNKLVDSIDLLSEADLRRALISLFKTRIYGINFKLSSMIIFTKFVSLLTTLIFFLKGDFNTYTWEMICWCACFMIRIYISFNRYGKYFGVPLLSSTQPENKIKYDLPSFKFDKIVAENHIRLKNDIECCICKLEYEEGEDLIEFPCKGKHVFHGAC